MTGSYDSFLPSLGRKSDAAWDGELASGGMISVLKGLYRVESGGRPLAAAEFARPADTNAYAAGDAINNSTSAPTILTFADAARANAGRGIVKAAKIITSNLAQAQVVELLLFKVAPAALPNDNAAFTLAYAERASFIGKITFGAFSGGVAVANGLELPYDCGAAVDDIYGMLRATEATTPTSGQTFSVVLTAVRL